MQAVVFNPNYLVYVDVSVTEYWRAMAGGDMRSLSSIFDNVYVVKSTVEYHGSAHFDDELSIGVRTARIGTSSMQVRVTMYRGDTHLISVENVYVYAVDGQSQPIPDAFRALVSEYEPALHG